MTKKLWQYLGQLAFWVSYPLLMVYLRIGRRTRVLIIVGDKVLVLKGWLGSRHWQLPGGGMHRAEMPVEGAIREVKEETGIILKPEALDFLYETTEHSKGLQFRCYCFVVKLDEYPPLVKQKWEIVDATWLDLSAITKSSATADTYHAVQAWLGL